MSSCSQDLGKPVKPLTIALTFAPGLIMMDSMSSVYMIVRSKNTTFPIPSKQYSFFFPFSFFFRLFLSVFPLSSCPFFLFFFLSIFFSCFSNYRFFFYFSRSLSSSPFLSFFSLSSSYFSFFSSFSILQRFSTLEDTRTMLVKTNYLLRPFQFRCIKKTNN